MLANSGLCARQETEAERPLNVLVVDTLRADRLGCQGNDSGLTPAIDAAAAVGVRFSRANAHSPWTLPSIASLLTSRHPSRHRAGEKLGPFRFSTLPGDVPTLQQRFGDAGYRTAAVINVDFLSSAFGMTRGFNHVDFAASDSNSETRRAAPTTDAALGRLNELAGAPFFLLVHYFDPHLEYDPPAAYRRRHARRQDPTEQTDIAGSSTGHRDRMLADLQWVREQLGSHRQPEATGAVDLEPDQVRRLRALGYLE